MTSKARRVLKALFMAFFEDVSLMPPEHRDLALHSETTQGATGRARAVADYIAGMTDRYAILEHRRMFDAGERTCPSVQSANACGPCRFPYCTALLFVAETRQCCGRTRLHLHVLTAF